MGENELLTNFFHKIGSSLSIFSWINSSHVCGLNCTYFLDYSPLLPRESDSTHPIDIKIQPINHRNIQGAIDGFLLGRHLQMHPKIFKLLSRYTKLPKIIKKKLYTMCAPTFELLTPSHIMPRAGNIGWRKNLYIGIFWTNI